MNEAEKKIWQSGYDEARRQAVELCGRTTGVLECGDHGYPCVDPFTFQTRCDLASAISTMQPLGAKQENPK